MMKVYLLLVILTISMVSKAQYANISTTDRQAVFKAGAATSNITPELGEPIVGNFSEPLAGNIHDELHARCLVLDDGTTKLVFVIVDNVGIDQVVFNEAKRLINDRMGIPREHLLMSAVHTHSATSAGGKGDKRRGWNREKPLDEYQAFLVKRIADGVQVAINRLEPACIGWGLALAPEHLFNRRWFMKEPVMNPFGGWDQVKMNPGIGNPGLLKPAGGTDPEISFISVQSISGRPIALLANYSLHYVGGVPEGDISGDYFAVFADRIKELLNAERQDPPFVAMLSNGTSGDVNNINFGGLPVKYLPYEKMKIVADDVARKVLNVHQGIRYHNWVKLQAAQSELPLQVRRATPEMMKNIEIVLSRPDTAKPLFHPLEKVYAKRVLQMEQEWPDSINVILQTFKIGDLGVAAVPFEVFTATGLEIKSKSPFKPTFTIELANGSYGYLPTPEQHQWGGYETWLGTNKVEINASRKIEKELLNLFSKMR